MRAKIIAISIFVLFCNYVAWAVVNRPEHAVSWQGIMRGVSFSPYQAGQSPLEGEHPSLAQIDESLRFLANKVHSVRTYTALDGFAQVPELAEKYGLTVTAGAWLDHRLERNEREIESLLAELDSNSNIDRAIVGNEAILRTDLKVPELAAYLARVRNVAKIPISTAEPWHVWLKYPELAEHVDFIAAHLLPYWEGLPIDHALTFVWDRYSALKKAFPGKPVLIAEVGWPSGGNRNAGGAVPSRVDQAKFVREFLKNADARGADYFVMEAFDQPWKRAIEGEAGAHWGLFTSAHEQKFSMVGPVVENPLWRGQVLVATLLAIIPMVLFLWHWQRVEFAGQLFFAFLIQASASLVAWAVFVPFSEGVPFSSQIAWGVLVPAQFALLAVLLVNGLEFTEMAWTKTRRRRFPTLRQMHAEQPMVSLHLPICKEPPELVIQTLDSLAALDYPNFEVLVIDNNTNDESLWRPVADHCERLGVRFRFFTLGTYPGYKAGALNFALGQTNPAAKMIGVIDSDYFVRRDWLKSVVPYFSQSHIGFVQAPQDHREWQDDSFREMCNWEYAGFFHIGMVNRNERDAIIQHGTMTLIRRSALEEVGGWSEWCICEDAELGLRLLKKGYESVYINEVFGRGLTPNTFSGYKGQRFRWVYGAVQILKRHWSSLLPWTNGKLSAGQRYHFLTGWMPWFADALHLVFTMAALVWTLGLVLLPKYFDFPLAAFLLPTLAMFAFKIFHTVGLYRACVPCDVRQRWLAAVAGMSLTHVIARGVFKGLFTSSTPFLRTPKAEDKPALVQAFFMAREEVYLLSALWLAAIAVGSAYGMNSFDAFLWQAVLIVQSFPYLAALYCAVINVLPGHRQRVLLQPTRVPADSATSSAATNSSPAHVGTGNIATAACAPDGEFPPRKVA